MAAFEENTPAVEELLELIAAEKSGKVPLFGNPRQAVDFSLFTVRGHYVEANLGGYFQAMVRLGTTQFALAAPQRVAESDLDPSVIRRQTIDALLLDELAGASSADSQLEAMEGILAALVGSPDNLTLSELRQARSEVGIDAASQLLDEETFTDFQERVRAPGSQQILSQILLKDPMNPEPAAPAPALATAIVEEEEDAARSEQVPVADRLSASSYPNPFNAGTTIRFALGANYAYQPVELTIHNMQGQVVRRLLSQSLSPGNYSVRWDGRTDDGLSAASGTYSFRLDADTFSVTQKMALLK